jgi:glycosyltransferase involved in cell wall biosynthesis
VVCSKIYGLTDAVQENITGLMHEPGNVEQIKECLTALIMDKKKRLEMGQNGRDRAVKLFDQKVVVNNFVSFINKYE